MEQRLSPPRKGQGMDLKTLSPSSSTCRNSASKAGNFILKYLAIRVISASLKSGPKVLQQLAQAVQSISSKTSLCICWAILSNFLVAFSLNWLKLYGVPSAFVRLAGGSTQYQFL